MREKRCRQGFAIEEGCRLVTPQNEACGGYIRLKTGSDTPPMLMGKVDDYEREELMDYYRLLMLTISVLKKYGTN